jgi:hypothetical protein
MKGRGIIHTGDEYVCVFQNEEKTNRIISSIFKKYNGNVLLKTLKDELIDALSFDPTYIVTKEQTENMLQTPAGKMAKYYPVKKDRVFEKGHFG